MRLPSVLSPADLPAPELHAARLDGDLFAVDSCFCPVDEIEQPVHRAAAAHAGLSGRLIAEQLSAAWVWGALDVPPAHHQFCVGIGSRVSHSAARWMTLREVVIDDAEVVDLDGRLVTTRLRTTLDLVRFPEVFTTREATAVKRLGSDLSEAVQMVSSRRNLPNKRRALARLARCAAG